MDDCAFINKVNAVSCGQFGIYSISDNSDITLDNFVNVKGNLYVNLDEIKKTALAVCNNFVEFDSIRYSESKSEKFKQILKFVNDNICSVDLSLKNIALHFDCSMSFISRIFLENYKMHYSDYISVQRVKISLNCLKQGKSIAITSKLCGFSSPSSFRRVFLKLMNVPPIQYKNSI